MKLIYRIIRSPIKRDKFNLNLSLFVYSIISVPLKSGRVEN